MPADETTMPTWLREVEDALACRAAGVLLTFNTSDRVFLRESGLEVASLKYALAHHFAVRGYHVGSYSIASGFETLLPPGARTRQTGASPFADVPSASDPGLTLTALGRTLRCADSPVLLLVDYADHVAPHSSGMTAVLSPSQIQTLELLHSWGQDDRVKATRNFVILISYENAVSSLLTQGGGYRLVPINLPDPGERRAFTDFLRATRGRGYEDMLGELEPGLEVDEFARLTAGLRLIDIEQLFRQAGARHEPLSRESVRQAKQRAISQICRGLVEVIEPTAGFEAVAGSEHAKAYFNLIRQPWAKSAPGVPQGILLAGVPGTGKSHIVTALAYELTCPLLVMRNIREAWVGASERNLELVLWVTENLSPCILWTDEVDQAIGQRSTGGSGDSGTSERMLGRIFEFFGAMRHRGRILWVATTNRPDILDPALLDRFQVSIPFIHPTTAERAALIPLLAKQVGRTLREDVLPEEIARLAELQMLTVRSLQEIVVAAGLRADALSGSVGSPIGCVELMDAVADYKPTYNPLEHEFLALKALEMASFNSLLPWMSLGGLRSGAEWPRYVDPVVDRETGHLKSSELTQRLAELQRLRYAERTLR